MPTKCTFGKGPAKPTKQNAKPTKQNPLCAGVAAQGALTLRFLSGLLSHYGPDQLWVHRADDQILRFSL
jgi:hypothetical protein